MATAAQVQEYARSQQDVVTLAHRELLAFWATLDLAEPTAAKAALADFVVDLVQSYGPLSSTLAADFYDELRDAADPRSVFSAEPGEAGLPEQIRGSSNWAVQPLFPYVEDVFDDDANVVGTREIAANPSLALSRFQSSTQRLVQDWGRQTLIDAAERDPSRPGWARMPIGETCRWCRMLASRGAVYGSAEKALHREDGGLFHDDDDCQPVPVWSDDDLPYDPKPLLDEYLAERAGGKSSKDPKVSAFDAMTREQVELQIRITDGLKDSPWRTQQLDRLRTRLTQL